MYRSNREQTNSVGSGDRGEEVAKALRDHNVRLSRCVTCEYHEGVLILRGILPSYYLKQIAQTVASKVPAIEQVDNRIEVFAAHEQQIIRDHHFAERYC